MKKLSEVSQYSLEKYLGETATYGERAFSVIRIFAVTLGTVEMFSFRSAFQYLLESSPHTRIVIRSDSGFCRETLMAFFESHDRTFPILGLARNSRLQRAFSPTVPVPIVSAPTSSGSGSRPSPTSSSAS